MRSDGSSNKAHGSGSGHQRFRTSRLVFGKYETLVYISGICRAIEKVNLMKSADPFLSQRSQDFSIRPRYRALHAPKEQSHRSITASNQHNSDRSVTSLVLSFRKQAVWIRMRGKSLSSMLVRGAVLERETREQSGGRTIDSEQQCNASLWQALMTCFCRSLVERRDCELVSTREMLDWRGFV